MIINAIVKIGHGKSNCDDTVLINDYLISCENATITCQEIKCIFVADGVGGNKGGSLASQFVLSRIRDNDFTDYSYDDLVLFFEKINNELIEFSALTKDMKNMATTLTGIIHVCGRYYIVHIGNTRIYVKQGMYLNQVTTDQTLYQLYIDRNLVNEASTVGQNVIYSCMGGGNKKYYQPCIKEVFNNEIPSVILLTSDGIHDYLPIEIMEENIKNYNGISTLEEICKVSTKCNSNDDMSIIVIQKGN